MLALYRLSLVAALALTGLVACASPELAAHEQAVVTDCLPVGQFAAVPLPKIKQWDGVIPTTYAKTVFVVQRDSQYPGNFVAWQVDWDTQQITWARRIPVGQMSSFYDQGELAAVLVRWPNPPPPPDTEAIDLFEIAFRAQQMEHNVFAEIVPYN